MIRAARVHPHIRLCAGADPLSRPREAFARDYGGRAYAEFHELCEDPLIEAIYIASPHQFHADQAIFAMEHGKHVLVEKPLALTLEDCDRIIAAADSTGQHLIVGHTHAFDPNIRSMRRLIEGGSLGRLGMILTFNYTDFLFRPHSPAEFAPGKGGGVVFNQVAHQVEIVRSLAGERVRSVRAAVGQLDQGRPADGNCMAFLEFDSGAAATVVYSSYDFFDSDEFHHWVAEAGTDKPRNRHGATRRALLAQSENEALAYQNLGYGGRDLPGEQPYQPHFGVIVVTCAKGDIRLSPNGLIVHDVGGTREIAVERGTGRPGQGDALDALWAALREERPSVHDANWGKATLEVVLAILQSSKERREIVLR